MKRIFRSRPVRIVLGLAVLVVVGELAARALNVDPSYVRSGRIRRACGCRELRIEHAPIGVDTSVRYCVNRLGLRGVLPADGSLRIITLGNSTTECAYIDDRVTWPHLLACGLTAQGRDVWIGNAGLNGSSTYGNALFLEDYLLGLRPDLVIFMPGAADRGRISPRQDAGLLAPKDLSFPEWLMEKSVLVGSATRQLQAHHPRHIDWSMFVSRGLGDDTTRKRGDQVPWNQQEAFVPGYRERLERIADLCAANKVHLLLLTQPILAPDSSDTRRIMERYNRATRELAASHALPLFDLAKALEQDPAFYLDGIHFSNAGATEVSRLLEPFVAGEIDRLGHR